MEAEARKTPRFWMAVQPSFIRLYKLTGLVALGAILIGLIGFLIVNIFYFFDHSWVRPVVLTPTHAKVVEAQRQLAEEKLTQSKLEAEKLQLESQLAEMKSTTEADDKFLVDIGALADAPKTPEQWMVRREVDRARLDKLNRTSQLPAIDKRLESLRLSIKEQDEVVRRVEGSPYLRAAKGKVVLAFVPYSNHSVKEQTKLYGCSWGLVMCSNVGKVIAVYDGEVTDNHPHNNSVQRGRLVEIDVTAGGANETVLFADGKPLWLF